MSGMKNFLTCFPDYFTLYSNKQFLLHCVTIYYWAPVLLFSIVWLYYRHKQWNRLGLLLLSFFGYLFLVNVSYPTSATPVFYIENLHLPIGFFLALPLVYDVLPRLNDEKVVLSVFLLLALTAAARFYQTHFVYTARLDWERRFLKAHGNKKLIYPDAGVPMDTLMMVWGTPYEFWLLSTIEQGRSASIIIDPKPEVRLWANQHNRSIS